VKSLSKSKTSEAINTTIDSRILKRGMQCRFSDRYIKFSFTGFTKMKPVAAKIFILLHLT
jgi:hypothetical protein